MTVTVDLWQLLSAIGGGLSVLATITLMLFKLILSQFEKRLNTRLKGLEESEERQMHELQRVDRELLGLKADLPLNYVLRDDYIRNQSIIESKLDGLALRIENAMLRGDKHARYTEN